MQAGHHIPAPWISVDRKAERAKQTRGLPPPAIARLAIIWESSASPAGRAGAGMPPKQKRGRAPQLTNRLP